MKQNSGYFQHLEQIQIAIERDMKQVMVDTFQIALHRKGIGFDRMTKIMEEWQSVYEEYRPCFKKSAETDVVREHMDRELRDLVKDKQEFVPFEKRYPTAHKVSYDRKR